MSKIYLAKNTHGAIMGAFYSKDEAEKVSGEYGDFKYKTSSIQEVLLFDNIKCYEDNRREEVKRRVMLKLTDEEKEVLGLV